MVINKSRYSTSFFELVLWALSALLGALFVIAISFSWGLMAIFWLWSFWAAAIVLLAVVVDHR